MSTNHLSVIELETWKTYSYEKRKSFTGILKYPNGSLLYFENGYNHRLDGPSVIRFGGAEEYWIHGRNFNIEDYWKQFEVITYKIKNSKEFQDLLKFKNL